MVIQAPPRHGKSELISKYLPAWFLLTHPDKRVMLSSYEANFAKTWGRKAREIVAEVGPDLCGVRVSNITSAADSWETTAGGGMVTAGVGGPLTGKGADVLLIDDPIKNSEEALSPTIRQKHWDWWQSTASTRIEPGGLTVVMNTRWHKEDLAGRLLEAAENGDGPPVWLVNLPAIAEEDDILGREPGEPLWPQRYPLDVLEEIKASRDPFWWNALYQQRPSRAGRMEWPDSYFDGIFVDEWPEQFDVSVIAVDPSKGKDARRGDYCAIVMVGLRGGKLWVDSMLDRIPPETIVERGIEMARRYRPLHFGIEVNMFQELLAGEFDRKTRDLGVAPLPIATITNTVNKDVRIGKLGTYLSRGLLRLKRSASNRLMVDQMKEWPLGDHDDGPDALEMAIRLMNWATSTEHDREERVYG